MEASANKPSSDHSPQKATGRPIDLWELHHRRHPFHFLHALFYLGNTRRYVNILATTYELIQRHTPRAWYRWPLIREFLRFVPDRYHGKVLKYEHARKILELNRDLRVEPAKAEKVLTYKQVNRIVMKSPDVIAVGDCSCRKRKKDHCEPIHVCMFVGEPFATYAVQHGQALNVNYVTRDEALEILRQAHEAGFVHNAFFKDALGDRLFAICNCCSCCCGVMNIQKDFNDIYADLLWPPGMLLPSGFSPVLDHGLCDLCGSCVEACPFTARSIIDERLLRVDPRKCFGCGVCETTCPREAVRLRENREKGIPLDVEALTQQGDAALQFKRNQ